MFSFLFLCRADQLDTCANLYIAINFKMNSFIDAYLINNKLYIFKVYNLT